MERDAAKGRNSASAPSTDIGKVKV